MALLPILDFYVIRSYRPRKSPSLTPGLYLQLTRWYCHCRLEFGLFFERKVAGNRNVSTVRERLFFLIAKTIQPLHGPKRHQLYLLITSVTCFIPIYRLRHCICLRMSIGKKDTMPKSMIVVLVRAT